MPYPLAVVGTTPGTSRLPPTTTESTPPKMAMRSTRTVATAGHAAPGAGDPLGNAISRTCETGRHLVGWLLAPWMAGGRYLASLMPDAPDTSGSAWHPCGNTAMATAMQQTLAPVMSAMAQAWEQIPSATLLGDMLRALDQCLSVGLPGSAAAQTDAPATPPTAMPSASLSGMPDKSRAESPAELPALPGDIAQDQATANQNPSSPPLTVMTHEALSYPQAFWHLYKQLLKVDQAAESLPVMIPEDDLHDHLIPHDENVHPLQPVPLMRHAHVEPQSATAPATPDGTQPEQRVVTPATARALPAALQRIPPTPHTATLAHAPADVPTPHDLHAARTTVPTRAMPAPEPATPRPTPAATAAPAARTPAAPSAGTMYCPDLLTRFSEQFKVRANHHFNQNFLKTGGHLSGVLVIIQVPTENLGQPANADSPKLSEIKRKKASIQQLVDFFVMAGAHRYRAMVDFVDDPTYPPPQHLCWQIPAPYCVGSADTQRVIDLARKARDANHMAKAFLEFMHDKIDATRFDRGSETDFLHNQQAFERALADVEGPHEQDDETDQRVEIPKSLRASYRRLREATKKAAGVFITAEKASQRDRDQSSATRIRTQREQAGGDRLLVLTQEKTLIDNLLAAKDIMVIAFTDKTTR